MLQDGDKMILPVDIKEQVQWEKALGVVVITLAREGEPCMLHMSSLTVQELAFLKAQLDAHISNLFGFMKEG